MYMDDAKIIANNKMKLKTLKQIVRIFNEAIGIESWMGQYNMLTMNKVKREITKGKELPHKKKRTLEEK